MALSVKQILRRHGAFVSAVTALLVAATIVLLVLLQVLISLAVSFDETSASALAGVWGYGLLTAIPFAVGFFLSLWVIAPIAEELRIGHVITRAILATGVGATVVFIVHAVLALTGAVTIPGSLFGNSLGAFYDFGFAANGLGRALSSALAALLTQLPLGVLAGVLLWVWRKEHPPKHPLSGLIDEV